jgi:hypothetical protein
MNQNEIGQMATHLRATAEVYGTKLSEGMLTMYTADLSEFSLQDVLESLKRCRKECKFFPRPVDVLERLAGSTKKDAEEALAIVYERLLKGSIYCNYQLIRNGKPDTVLMQTVKDMGGMLAANENILTDWKWRQDFMDRYITNARHPEMCQALKLSGANPEGEPIRIESGKPAALPGIAMLEAGE